MSLPAIRPPVPTRSSVMSLLSIIPRKSIVLSPLFSPPMPADSPLHLSSQIVNQPREETARISRQSIYPRPLVVVVHTCRNFIQRRDQVSCCRLWSLSLSLSLWCFCRGSVLPPSSHHPVNQVFKPNRGAKQSFVAIVFWLGKLLLIAHLPTGVKVLFSNNSTALNLCLL